MGLLGVLAMGCAAPTDLPAVTTPNVLVVVLDDVGVDRIAAYEVFGPGAGNYPTTPTLDGLIARGVRFQNAYAMPLCSATRATLMTGRYPYRHGVGGALELGDWVGMTYGEVTVAEVLRDNAPDPWSLVWLGKWHLATLEEGYDAPLTQGFDHYAGSIGNLYPKFSDSGGPNNYNHWQKDTDGLLSWTETYATTDTIRDAVQEVATLPEPWFLGVALNAAHEPFALPPDGTWSGTLLGDTSVQQAFHAMIESADGGLGQLLDALPDPDNTYVIVLGDNGSPSDMAMLWERPARMKDSLYELGIRVPMVVAGPGVAEGGVSEAFVSPADLLPTVAAIAGAALPEDPIDGLSLLPYLTHPGAPSARTYAFSETFEPPGRGNHDTHRRMVRDARFKLVQRLDHDDELYDLGDDLTEGRNLLAHPRRLEPDAEAAYAALLAQMPTELGQ